MDSLALLHLVLKRRLLLPQSTMWELAGWPLVRFELAASFVPFLRKFLDLGATVSLPSVVAENTALLSRTRVRCLRGALGGLGSSDLAP